MTFVFFDTETTGTNIAFDQIIQFAGIQTDNELNELTVLDVRCRLLPHIVASPEALLVNGTTAERLVDVTLQSHYQMVRTIHAQLVAWSPTLFIGYNSLSFDENLLRQAFYQTLHQPYLTNTNGNCRADAFRFFRLAAAFAPDCLVVPKKADGRPSFKLDDIASANGYTRAGAHDALDDSRATIHLCKLVMERAPDLWSNFTRFAQRRAVVDYLESEVIFGLCGFRGHEASTYILTSLGASPSYGADYLTFDLSNDPTSLRQMSDEELIAALSQPPYIVRRIRVNACPALLSADDALAKSPIPSADLHELEQRATEIQKDTSFKQRLIEFSERTRKVYPPSVYVERQIYDGFIPDGDKPLMESFHAARWEDREAIINRLQDRRLKQLGRRLIFFERPDLLESEQHKAITRAIAERIIKSEEANAWLCITKAIEQAEDLMTAASESERDLLSGHRDMWKRQYAALSAELVS